MPLNKSVCRFLRAGARGTVSWAGIVGRSSRDDARRNFSDGGITCRR
jgi:hypothetical protein